MAAAYTLTPGELRGLQMVLLEMLTEVDRICKKHGIRYCLIAGTLLGAVRHGGFIPWDDDLDVAMLRPEYERFREACRADLDASRFFFQDHTTDPHYRWGWGRVRRLDSEFLRTGQEHMKMRTGIFLDVFPMDHAPDFYPLRAVHNFYCFLLRKLLYSEVGMAAAGSPLRRGVYRLLHRIPLPFVFRRLERLAAFWNKRGGQWVRKLTFPTPKNGKFGYLGKWYANPVDISFEGLVFPGVGDWDEYLTFKFGDYRTPPPPEGRRVHPVSAFRLPEGWGSNDGERSSDH